MTAILYYQRLSGGDKDTRAKYFASIKELKEFIKANDYAYRTLAVIK